MLKRSSITEKDGLFMCPPPTELSAAAMQTQAETNMNYIGANNRLIAVSWLPMMSFCFNKFLKHHSIFYGKMDEGWRMNTRQYSTIEETKETAKDISLTLQRKLETGESGHFFCSSSCFPASFQTKIYLCFSWKFFLGNSNLF